MKQLLGYLLIALTVAGLGYGFLVVVWLVSNAVQAADLNRKSDYQRPTFDQRFGSFCILDDMKQKQMEALIKWAGNDKR